jgi:lambda repressor-like predicted transcriptional regulator
MYPTGMARSRQEWRSLISLWKQSGMTMREFAEKRGLNHRTLGHWGYILRKQDRENESTLAKFIEIQPATVVATNLEYQLRDGGKFSIPRGFPAQAFAEFVRALEARP